MRCHTMRRDCLQDFLHGSGHQPCSLLTIQQKAELSAQKPVEEAVGKCKTCTEEQCGEALEGDEACVAEICVSKPKLTRRATIYS